MLRWSWVVASLAAAGCYCSHPRPMDAGTDAPVDAGAPDVCMLFELRCDDGVDDADLAVASHATFDGERIEFTRAVMVTSYAFAVFHQVTLSSPACGGPRIHLIAGPPDFEGDADALGPRSAVVYLSSERTYEGMGRMDVLAFDRDTGIWRGHLVVDDARMQLDVELEVPRCTDVSGP